MSESTALVPVKFSWDTKEGVATIKQTVAKGATDAQLFMFLEVCRSTGLNPFLREVWFIQNKNQPESSQIMAGRDGYLRVANEHPAFDGMETKVEWNGERTTPIRAVCTVWRKDRTHPITMEAEWRDYYKSGSAVWTQYKGAMISKVAEVLALKRAFSINGVVTEEEVATEPRQPAEIQAAVVVQSEPSAAAPPPSEMPADLPLTEQEIAHHRLKELLISKGIEAAPAAKFHASLAASMGNAPPEFLTDAIAEWFAALDATLAQPAAPELTKEQRQILAQIKVYCGALAGRPGWSPDEFKAWWLHNTDNKVSCFNDLKHHPKYIEKMLLVVEPEFKANTK